MSHYSQNGQPGMGIGMGGYPANMQSSYYGQGGNHNNSFSKGAVKKKNVGAAKGHNGMLAALHPSGTIHVGGSGGVNAGMLSTDFKMTMKHNSSNHSIQSTKKMIGTIRKPTDLLGTSGNQPALSGKKHNNNHHGSGGGGGNYMSPYSQKMAVNGKHMH